MIAFYVSALALHVCQAAPDFSAGQALGSAAGALRNVRRRAFSDE
jgi:hypothetical protein